jgi:hypothetical protein
MSVRHWKATEWEQRLREVFRRIDEELEARYGARYPLHPARSPRGTTASHEDDGLFDIGAVFTPGFGSQQGRGYLVEVRMATLANVPADVVERIERDVVERLRAELPKAFPNQNLRVERDGHHYKIIGGLALGNA